MTEMNKQNPVCFPWRHELDQFMGRPEKFNNYAQLVFEGWFSTLITHYHPDYVASMRPPMNDPNWLKAANNIDVLADTVLFCRRIKAEFARQQGVQPSPAMHFDEAFRRAQTRMLWESPEYADAILLPNPLENERIQQLMEWSPQKLRMYLLSSSQIPKIKELLAAS